MNCAAAVLSWLPAMFSRRAARNIWSCWAVSRAGGPDEPGGDRVGAPCTAGPTAEPAVRRRPDRCLIGQIEATWATLDDDGRAQLLPRLDWIAAMAFTSARTATRLRQLTIAAANDAPVPYGLIDDASPVGRDLIAVLTASPEPDRAKAGLIRLLTAYPGDGKPGRTWREEAGPVVAALHGPVVIGALLDAALNAPDREPTPSRSPGPASSPPSLPARTSRSSAVSPSSPGSWQPRNPGICAAAPPALKFDHRSRRHRAASAWPATRSRRSPTLPCPRRSPSCSRPSAAPGTARCCARSAGPLTHLPAPRA